MNLDTLLAASGRHGSQPLDLLIGLTLLSLVPLLLVMCTSFVRIVVVLSLVRVGGLETMLLANHRAMLHPIGSSRAPDGDRSSP